MAKKVRSGQMNVVPNSSDANGSVQIGNVLIQWGRSVIAQSGTFITFPVAYTQIPAVTVTTHDPNSWPGWVSQVTATGFTGKQEYTTNPLNVNWIAVGYKA